MTLGSNYSDPVPKAGLAAAVEEFPNQNVQVITNTVDHNTFQENITTYLQNPDDVIPWFAGYRMQFFAAQDLLGPIDDVWEAGLNDQMSEGFKLASTGQDGKLYFVSEDGQTIVVKSGRTPEVLARNDLGERQIASPAVSNGQIFIRTDDHVFAIGK